MQVVAFCADVRGAHQQTLADFPLHCQIPLLNLRILETLINRTDTAEILDGRSEVTYRCLAGRLKRRRTRYERGEAVGFGDLRIGQCKEIHIGR